MKRLFVLVAAALAVLALSTTPAVAHGSHHDHGCKDDLGASYGGGWNLWNIGVVSPEVMEKIVQPDLSQPLYICGDAYSNWAGWVEGALETADMVLAKILPLKPIVVTNTGIWSVRWGSTPYRFQLTAEGGVSSEPYHWDLVGGSLPPNWTMTPDGIISGIPSHRGTYTCSVVASQKSTGTKSAPANVGFWIDYPL